jgi:hypothetical protein
MGVEVEVFCMGPRPAKSGDGVADSVDGRVSVNGEGVFDGDGDEAFACEVACAAEEPCGVTELPCSSMEEKDGGVWFGVLGGGAEDIGLEGAAVDLAVGEGLGLQEA